jgi:hypothetical protein
MVEIKLCNNVNQFIKVAFLTQGNDPNWVPPILMDIKKKLGR